MNKGVGQMIRIHISTMRVTGWRVTGWIVPFMILCSFSCATSLPWSLPEARDALYDPDPEVRQLGALQLGYNPSESESLPDRSLAALVRAVEDSDSGVRDNAIWALGRFGSGAGGAIPALVEQVRQGNYLASYTLSKIGKEVVPHVTRLFSEEQSNVRYLAAFCLWQLGPDAKGAEDSLQKLLEKETDSEVRSIVTMALNRMRKSVPREDLGRDLGDPGDELLDGGVAAALVSQERKECSVHLC